MMRSHRKHILSISLLLLTIGVGFVSLQINFAKADTYNQIPLWINIMEGVDSENENTNEIERVIDSIFKMHKLNWRVTSTVLDENCTDPDKEHDQPGDVRIDLGSISAWTEEQRALFGKGDLETENMDGLKIFVVKRILDKTGQDAGLNGVAAPSFGTAIVTARGNNTFGAGYTWAHELGHLFGLDHVKPDGKTQRPAEDLMYEYANHGPTLQEEDIAVMNRTKIEKGLGLPTLTNDQRGTVYSMYRALAKDAEGDSPNNFTDIKKALYGFYVLNETKQLSVTTYLNGIIPESSSLTYFVAIDSDHDSSTGGEVDGWLGIDLIVVADVLPSKVTEAVLYSYPSHEPITTLESRIETNYLFVCTQAPPPVPPALIQDNIVINLPLEFLEPYSDYFRIGTWIQESENMAADILEISDVSTSPPQRPTLTFNPPVAHSGSIIETLGSGFNPNQKVSIIFDHRTLSTVQVSFDGSFQTDFILPELSVGHYMVDAIDEAHNIAVAMSTITIRGDVDRDYDVDIFDIVILAGIYGASKPDPQYEARGDLNNDGSIDIFDIVIAAGSYGSNWQP